MPSLTLDTSPRSQRRSSISEPFEESSPPQPPYSPITPTLGAARLATGHNAHRARYTHEKQEPQIGVSLPPLIPVDFSSNPDVLALQATISILQLQKKRAEADAHTLQRIKEKALSAPEQFVTALAKGEVKVAGDPLFHPSEDVDSDAEVEGAGKAKKGGAVPKEKWETIPKPQNIVRMPPINWNQYAVMGESLDKLHEDQMAHPTDGVPQRLGSDGQLISGGDGMRHETTHIATPYRPGVDKTEKMGTRKAGKR